MAHSEKVRQKLIEESAKSTGRLAHAPSSWIARSMVEIVASMEGAGLPHAINEMARTYLAIAAGIIEKTRQEIEEGEGE